MISFENDYIAGAHPKILERLADTNRESLGGYGTDRYCESAREKIRQACECPQADVYFLIGGTQTNAVVIASMLREYEGVIAAQTGHVSIHEAGAVENTGHKVLEVPHTNGKIMPHTLEKYLEVFYQDPNHEHMVFPGMVYISYPTEYGTLYSHNELQSLYKICQGYQIPLYIDGARLGYGLMSRGSDLSLAGIAGLCDVFYIGGTKAGALCGEAVVFPRGNAPEHMMTTMKRHGALLAKGRLLGVQFDTLFTDDLYYDISRHAIDMAEQLTQILEQAGLQFYLKSPTNQQFVILEDGYMERLKEHVLFSFWEHYDENHTIVRFAVSWSTTQEDLDQLKAALLV